MDLIKMLENGETHVAFNDGYEADFRKGGSGNLIFYNQMISGKPVNKGNVVVRPEDADSFTKDHQGIKETAGAGQIKEEQEFEQFVAEEQIAKAEEVSFDDIFDEQPPIGPAPIAPVPEKKPAPNPAEEAPSAQAEEKTQSIPVLSEAAPSEPIQPMPVKKLPEPQVKSVEFLSSDDGSSKSNPTRTDVISEGTVIGGDIATNVSINIQGEVHGKVNSKGFVTTSATSSIEGDITSSEGMSIKGTVRGEVRSDGEISAEGTIIGNLKAADIILNNATIKGNINGENVTISSGSAVAGNVRGKSFAIAGTVKGNITAEAAVQLRAGAAVLGDIKASKVIIEDGAYLKGKIEQDGEADFESRFSALNELKTKESTREKADPEEFTE